MKPIAMTASCQADHRAYFISGRMKVVMDDGDEMEYGRADFAIMPPATTRGSSATSLAS